MAFSKLLQDGALIIPVEAGSRVKVDVECEGKVIRRYFNIRAEALFFFKHLEKKYLNATFIISQQQGILNDDEGRLNF